MVYNSAKSARQEYLHVIKLQLGLALAVIVGVGVFSRSSTLVISAILGSLLVLLPAMLYVKIAWSPQVLAAPSILARHKKAELIKFMTTIIGFGLVFSCYRELQALVLFAAYVVTLSSYWICLLRQAKRST